MKNLSKEEILNEIDKKLEKIEKNPKDGESLNDLGVLLSTIGDFQRAQKFYFNAIENGNVRAMFNLGVLYINTDKKDLAEKCFLEMAKLKDGDSMNYLGLIYK